MDGKSDAGPMRLSRLSGAILILLGMVLAFFLGYAPGLVQAGHTRDELASHAAELAATKQALARMTLQRDLARLEDRLGMALYEADRNNFGNAATLSTQFFDRLRGELSVAGVSSVADAGKLRAVLARRDEISSDLARPDPAVKQKFAEIYVAFDQAIGAPAASQ